MMPPEQETGSLNTMASNVPVTNRSDNSSVHAEPSDSSSSSDDKALDSDNISMPYQQQQTPTRFYILHKSLRPVSLKFVDVTYSVNLGNIKDRCFCSNEPKLTRNILNGVTGMVQSGELLAMLGPSGSGKTTLLTALSGRLTGKFSGSITYNGQPFSSAMKRKTGFVSQDDVLYPHLTVLETLKYAAFLRLPKDLSKEEKIEQAESVIVELGLTRCRNSPIGGGGALFRGISGGERKRVSIGHEMLVNPSLLLLDEPTSGLDSTTAARIVAMLRGLARGGRTVITTIHQPSSRLYMMFDKVVVLADGYPIYSGQASQAMDYFGSIGFMPGFNFINPADFLLDLANGIAPDAKQDDQLELYAKQEHHENHVSTKQGLVSCYKRNLYPALRAEINTTEREHLAFTLGVLLSRSSENQWTTTWWKQFNVLLKRSLRERRHESYSGLRIFQVMSVSFLSGLLWWHSDVSNLQDQVSLLFFFSIFWGFFPFFSAIFTFPTEKPMLIKEQSSSMYHLSSYYFARMVGDLPMELVLPTIFVTITYWMGGLKSTPFAFMSTLLIILVNVIVAQGIGLALGAILMDVKKATTLASVIMLVFLLAGGYYIQHMPFFLVWLKYMSFSHFCYKLLVRVQYSEDQVYECGLGLRCRVMEYPAIKNLGIDNMCGDVAALTVMVVGYRVLAYVALRIGLLR